MKQREWQRVLKLGDGPTQGHYTVLLCLCGQLFMMKVNRGEKYGKDNVKGAAARFLGTDSLPSEATLQ